MSHLTYNSFFVGCIGALAPEIIRLYKLRLNPTLQWSSGYLLFSFPFVLLGGFMAYILEPTTAYAAFYTGVSTPFIVTTLAKDSEREAKAIQRIIQEKEFLETELCNLQQRCPFSSDRAAPVIPQMEADRSMPDSGNAASTRSGLRSSSVASNAMPFSSEKNSAICYRPQSSPRRLLRWQIVQAFLKSL